MAISDCRRSNFDAAVKKSVHIFHYVHIFHDVHNFLKNIG